MYVVECEVPAAPGRWAKQAEFEARHDAVEKAWDLSFKGYRTRVRDDAMVGGTEAWQVIWHSVDVSLVPEPVRGAEPKCPDQPNDGRRLHCNERNCVVCAASEAFAAGLAEHAELSDDHSVMHNLLDEFKPDVALKGVNRPEDVALITAFAKRVEQGLWGSPVRQKTAPLYRELARLVAAYRHPGSTEEDKERYAGRWRELVEEYLPSGAGFSETRLDSYYSSESQLKFTTRFNGSLLILWVYAEFNGFGTELWPLNADRGVTDVFRQCLEQSIPVEGA